MTVDSNSHQVGATQVTSEKSIIKCSSMKSGVFLFPVNSTQRELMVFSPLYTQMVAQCTNNHPRITAVIP